LPCCEPFFCLTGGYQAHWQVFEKMKGPSLSGLPLEVMVTEFMSIHELETLVRMLERGKSSVLDVIGEKHIGT